MKFSSSILSAVLALSAASTTHAFSAQRMTPNLRQLCTDIDARSSGGGVRRSTSSVFSTPTEEKVEAAAATTTDDVASKASAAGLNDTKPSGMSPEFQGARDMTVAGMVASLPNPALELPLTHFMDEYFRALDHAAKAGAKNLDGSDITAQQAAMNMGRTLGFGTKYGLGAGPEGKFVFKDSTWKALRGDKDDERYGDLKAMLGDDVDTDFYAAGCDFFRPAMDLEKSLVLGVEHLEKAKEQIEAGENVVFLANHQSEADPQVVSCLFEKVGMGKLAETMTYVAGHKVTTDPLAVPFSMGRNLICIHSKKHIDADPETKPAKSRQNMSAMNGMLAGMKKGGMAIWVAPSGGRDRRDVESGKIPIAPFDQKTVDMFRLMGAKSKVPTHFYPMSMVSYDLCPPPDSVEAGVGEQRNVRFTPIGIAVNYEDPNVGGSEKRHLFTERAEEECIDGYVKLLKGMDMERYIP